jgi:hypothetical protein
MLARFYFDRVCLLYRAFRTLCSPDPVRPVRVFQTLPRALVVDSEWRRRVQPTRDCAD